MPAPIPGLRPIPLVGSKLALIRFFADPLGCLWTLRREHGPIAAINAGDPSLVCAFGAEHNRAVLSDAQQFQNFADVPFPVPPGASMTRLNTALTSMNGDVHRRHRRMMMPAFSKAAIQSYAGDMVSITDRFLARWAPGRTLDVAAEMIELTLHVAMRCLFGLDVSDAEDDLGHSSMRFLDGMTSVGVMLLPVRLPGVPYDRVLSLAEEIEARMRKLIAARRELHGAQRDMLSILIDAHDEDGSQMTDDELVGHTNIMLIAGHETTAHTLSWTLFLLSQHPRVHAEVADELSSVLRGAPPTVDDLARLPLLDAVIKESMRLLPPTPFLFLRSGVAGFRLGPFELPAGSRVILSPLVTHRDPDVFPDAWRFLPERWSSARPNPYEYLPFGAGPRMCIGAAFAAQAVRLELAMILQRFRLELAPGANVSTKVRGITLGPKHGVPMHLSRHDRAFALPHPVRGDVQSLVELPFGRAGAQAAAGPRTSWRTAM